jgi:hypothetical protein
VTDRRQLAAGGRQTANYTGLLVDDMVDEAGVLMAETVVALPPDVRAKEVVK